MIETIVKIYGILLLTNVYAHAILLDSNYIRVPLLLTTWQYETAVREGWKTLVAGNGTAVDAVEATGGTCERIKCRHSVGPGARPDESGETTLDAMIMDGDSNNVGAVGGLRRIEGAISVARHVLDHTEHTLLVGESATEFAVKMGFKEESLSSNYSVEKWNEWKSNACQPNYWKGVTPDPSTGCGPYQPITAADTPARFARKHLIGSDNHDTIGIIAIDSQGSVASGTSTNGLRFKIHGRVGDSPIPGAGSYADSDIGAAACTGNGDIMMRFLPSYQAVQLMGTGMTPTAAATQAINSIRRKYPDFVGAVVAANKKGEYGAACHNWADFAITIRNTLLSDVIVQNITCQ